MEAAVLTLPEAPTRTGAPAATVPWYVWAIALASTSIEVGVIWDISWHKTIGRDTFWTPAHLAIHFGGILAGATCGWLVLQNTFRGTAQDRASGVGFWGFRAPLGAWLCIWGALAMLVSAPFDNWWHNAYGLDVEILSPPHVVLAVGTAAIHIGALLLVLALQNRAEGTRRRVYAALYAYLTGILLSAAAIMTLEYTFRVFMHGPLFYQIVCGLFPLLLVAAGRATRLAWPFTAAAGAYTLIRLVMNWILPLFPAEPGLGPIYREITHMLPLDFPLLLLAPALVMDLVLRRHGGSRRGWLLAATLGATFFAVYLPVQWFVAEFLNSPGARNWFFNADNLPYWVPTTSRADLGIFVPHDGGAGALRIGLLKSLLFAVVSARLGLWWGNWMADVRR